MPTQILMPALSPTMEEGKLARWLVKEGDTVKSGDILAEIETDKATMEFEAVDEGRIGKILVPEGSEGVKVNAPIATLLADGEDASAAVAAPKKAQASPEARKESVPPAVAGSGPNKPVQEAPRQPAEHFIPAPSDPDLPKDVEMVTITVREALRDAMAEEMRRDASVFLMG